VTATDSQAPPIFRHSVGWSLLTGAFAVTLVFYAVGGAYVGDTSRPWLAGFLAAAGILALIGTAYARYFTWASVRECPRRERSIRLRRARCRGGETIGRYTSLLRVVRQQDPRRTLCGVKLMTRTLLVCAIVFAALAASAIADGPPLFPKPVRYHVAPQRACRSELLRVPNPPGQPPSTQRIFIPGKPGLTAVAITPRAIRVDWHVAPAAANCRTAGLYVSVGHYATWLPITVIVYTHGRLSGSTRITFPDVGAPPDIAIASALTRRGGRSQIAGVLIAR
jgi:hypothetical protein